MANILVGKIIYSIKISSDKESLLFKTDAGDIIARCDADCCSYTWIEHIELPFKGFPVLVISADEIDMPDLGDMPECDVVAYYGFKIITDKGEILIDYRNDSNGCYAGNLLWLDDEYFYDGIYGKNVLNEEWQEILS